MLVDVDRKPLALERQLIHDGYPWVAGIDEAGRGALAGPVVAAAVLMNAQDTTLCGLIRDSKKHSALQRDKYYSEIRASAISVGVGIVEVDEIDRRNILQASLQAMKFAVERLKPTPSVCLIDGNQKIPSSIHQLCIVGGDDLIFSISAASIIAKVTRDRIMINLAEKYPEYGFIRNKGYGTKEHLSSLKQHGLASIHRKTFTKAYQ